MSLNLAAMVSGGGSNLQSIIDKIESGVLDARLKVVISNNPEAFGLERARRAGIEAVALPHREYMSREAFDRDAVAAIRDAGADTVALAGFMRLVTPFFLGSFPDRVVNIHPALLPGFPGVRGQGDAADYGVKLSGCTVHFVTEAMDSGPIIIQAAVPAFPAEGGESLGKRILALEHRIYPQALQWLAEDRLRVEGRFVYLRETDDAPDLAAPGVDFLVNPPLEQGF